SLPGDRIIDGQSLLPSLTGQAQMSQPRQFFYFHGNQLMGIRNQEMKYIDLPFPALFDLDRDPSEAYNLIQENPQGTDTLSKQLEAWESKLYDNSRGWL
ncbi:MAG: hypothetical protein MI747_03170, partial [Desulfobacterales bacterium]|nr:hypothetical protein [Desulfobacterales bacterium]